MRKTCFIKYWGLTPHPKNKNIMINWWNGYGIIQFDNGILDFSPKERVAVKKLVADARKKTKAQHFKIWLCCGRNNKTWLVDFDEKDKGSWRDEL